MYYAITMQSNDVKCTAARQGIQGTATTKHTIHRGAPRCSAAQFHRAPQVDIASGDRRHPETRLDQTRVPEWRHMASRCNGAAKAKKIKKCWNLEALWKKALYWRLAEQVPVQIEVLRRIDCIVNPEPVSFINPFAYWQMMRRGHHSLELECSKGTVFAFATGSPLHTHKVSHVTLTRFMTKRANMWKRWLSGRAKIRCCRGYYHKYACKVIC